MEKFGFRARAVPNKGKQASFILRVSLLTLETQKPNEFQFSRARVLSMIRVKRFVAYKSISSDVWDNSGTQVRQFFSWCRQDLTTQGLMAWCGTSDYGIWRLSAFGREKTKHRILLWGSSGKTADEIFDQYQDLQFETIFSKEFVNHALKLASKIKPLC